MHPYSMVLVQFLPFLTCAVTSAWWVQFGQVQMREGGYDVRGKRNYLPPVMLALGYGVLWMTDDEATMQRHGRPLITTEAPPDPEEEKREAAVEEIESDGDESSNEIDEVEKHEGDDEGPATNEAEGHPEDKYNLDEFGSPEVGQEEEKKENLSAESSVPSSKRHLTAKQRRDLKKGKSIQSHPDSKKQNDSEYGQLDEPTSILNATSVSKQKPQPIIRGKRGKMKKIKAKYADQSDEERELARKILGGQGPVEKNPDTTPPQPIQPVEKPLAPPPPARPPKPIEDDPLEVLQSCRRWLILPGPRSIHQGIHCGPQTRGRYCRCSDSLRPLVRLNPLQV